MRVIINNPPRPKKILGEIETEEEELKSLLSQIKSNHRGVIEISIKTPAEEKSLQAVDFISWAIFRKHEKGDDSYYNIIKNKIIEENPLFP